jgi:hypothetical protein
MNADCASLYAVSFLDIAKRDGEVRLYCCEVFRGNFFCFHFCDACGGARKNERHDTNSCLDRSTRNCYTSAHLVTAIGNTIRRTVQNLGAAAQQGDLSSDADRSAVKEAVQAVLLQHDKETHGDLDVDLVLKFVTRNPKEKVVGAGSRKGAVLALTGLPKPGDGELTCKYHRRAGCVCSWSQQFSKPVHT